MESYLSGNDNMMSVIQNLTEYKPTEKESQLLEVLLTPEHRMKSITDICKLACCSRVIYYEAFKKPGFQALYKAQSRALVDQSIAPVLNTFVREALRGSFQHGKVILEMAGLYSEKSTVEVTGELLLSAEDRRQRIAELLQRPVIEGIKAEYKALPEPDQGE
jgi:hypothetical protein